jgi:predicted flap endonuclease-1-like 5' DNA nuclease
VVYGRSSAENESNNNVANDEQTVSQKGDHDDVTNTETISQTSGSIVDLEIYDIEGIGPTTTKKLKEAGIVSAMDLAVASAEELAIDINSSKESAATFVIGAQKLLV